MQLRETDVTEKPLFEVYIPIAMNLSRGFAVLLLLMRTPS